MFIDYIFPKSCIFCSKIGTTYICNSCLKDIPISLPQCYYCKKINNNCLTHHKCNGYYKQVYSGWYIDMRRYKRIIKSEEYIYIDIVYQLCSILVERFKLQDFEILTDNKNLGKQLNRDSKKKKICLIDRSNLNSSVTDIGISIFIPQKIQY